MDLSDVWLCGDLHGEIAVLERAFKDAEHKPRLILLLGDLQPPKPAHAWLRPLSVPGTEVWFIHGNHDTDSWDDYRNVFEGPGTERNIDGRVIEVDGLRVAGLGGIFREQIWKPPEESHFQNPVAYADYCSGYIAHDLPKYVLDGRKRTHRSSIFPETYDRLANQHADLLIAHEAPSCHPHGYEEIDLLAQAMGCRWVAHGHHHDALDYSGRDVRLGFHAIGVGLRGVTTLAGEVVVRGQLDAARAERDVRTV